MKSKRKNIPLDTKFKVESKTVDTMKYEAAFNKAHAPYKRSFEDSEACSSDTLKQEDHKPSILSGALMQADHGNARHERNRSQEITSRDSGQIKQEDLPKTKECLSDIEHRVDQRNKDFYYRCSLCKERQENLQAVWQHHESVHLIKKTKRRSIIHLNLEPDVHDPNYYCQTCEKTSTSRANFRLHLRDVHQICLKPPPHTPNANVEPDPEDANGHCSACNHTYASKKHYRIHLKSVHMMNLPPSNVRKNTSVLPDWNNPDFFCASCQKQYATKATYHSHCRHVHYVRNPAKKTSKSEFPDPNDHETEYPTQAEAEDSQYRCHICHRKLANKISYQRHLISLHSTEKHTQKEPASLSKTEANYNCTVCSRPYSSRKSYKMHLVLAHQIKLENTRTEYNHNQLPDPLDPDCYCSACKTSYKTRYKYRTHCRMIHRLVISPSVTKKTFKYPNAEIDVQDQKNLYCAKCDISVKQRHSYLRHLKNIHNIILPKKDFPNPDATIDKSDPTFYCAKCEIHLSKRQAFENHIKNIHRL